MGAASSPGQGNEIIYEERFHLPWWWYLLGFLFAILVAVQLHLGRSGLWSVIPYAVMTAIFLAIAVVIWRQIWKQSIKVTIDGQGGGTLCVGDSWLPFDSISRGVVIPPSARQAAMGRQLDPMAFVSYHSWCPWMVLIVLDDPYDPCPYWLISTQHPTELLEALPNNDWAAQQTVQHTE